MRGASGKRPRLPGDAEETQEEPDSIFPADLDQTHADKLRLLLELLVHLYPINNSLNPKMKFIPHIKTL